MTAAEVLALDPLLERSWQRAWAGLGANGDGLEVRDALLAAWASPNRHYHTLRHLRDCLALLEPVLAQAEHPEEVEIAAWFHDAVYDPRAGDNEKRSAQWADTALASAGVPAAACARVRALVLATRHEAVPRSPDERLLVDVDLSILGVDSPRFEQYDAEVHREYAWVPRAIYRAKRRRILAAFLERPAIYTSGRLDERFELQARTNLERALRQLRPWWWFW